MNMTDERIKYQFKIILRSINQRCNDKSQISYPWYGGKGIKNYLTEEDIEYMWNRDNAKDMDKPSIDRIDSDKNYEFDNCRFIELYDNIGKMNHENKCKSILQLDLNGNLIKEWSSVIIASQELKLNRGNIASCARGVHNRKSVGGFIWRYKEFSEKLQAIKL